MGPIDNGPYMVAAYIVAAVVIGENPALFGFEFENPLAEIDVVPTDA